MSVSGPQQQQVRAERAEGSPVPGADREGGARCPAAFGKQKGRSPAALGKNSALPAEGPIRRCADIRYFKTSARAFFWAVEL